MDHPDLGIRDAIELMDIFTHRGRNGDHAVGVLIRGFFDPRAAMIRRPELFDLPRPMGFE